MSSDEDMMAQIANIEAQLSFQQQQQPQQAQQWQPTSTFGHPVQAAAAQGFPRQQGYPGAQGGAPAQVQPGHQFSKDTDDRSVFIGNLPKGQNGIMTTPEELAAFFQDCGPMLNVTVLKDKATGELKGTAYIEFATHEACGKALDVKNNANFKGSAITVCWSSSSNCPPNLTLPSRPLSQLLSISRFPIGAPFRQTQQNNTSHLAVYKKKKETRREKTLDVFTTTSRRSQKKSARNKVSRQKQKRIEKPKRSPLLKRKKESRAKHQSSVSSMIPTKTFRNFY
ncbi:RNA-binding protein, putative [Bodo saltans]|uniref:RNA-binding protein, putative n=1 Tax=Bodo saltans TaxID=75058 RepID=A0A0S4JTD8_BODSA|nr:RNA-binding protein, putative [Bodo saltans]|eukprot:CUG93636.1 RNA-binding protein, putative [Bodo saltans]